MTIIPKKSEVTIKRSSLIYVPIWKIGITCKDITYRRVAMAASKTVIVDEIERCSKDFSSLKFWTKWKITNALCQTCGILFVMIISTKIMADTIVKSIMDSKNILLSWFVGRYGFSPLQGSFFYYIFLK